MPDLAMLVLFWSISYLGVFIVSYVAQRLKGGQQEIGRMLREQEKTLTHLTVLQQIGTEISSIAGLDTVLDLIVTKARKLFATDTAFLALQEPGSENIRITVTSGEKTEPLEESKLRP